MFAAGTLPAPDSAEEVYSALRPLARYRGGKERDDNGRGMGSCNSKTIVSLKSPGDNTCQNTPS